MILNFFFKNIFECWPKYDCRFDETVIDYWIQINETQDFSKFIKIIKLQRTPPHSSYPYRPCEHLRIVLNEIIVCFQVKKMLGNGRLEASRACATSEESLDVVLVSPTSN